MNERGVRLSKDFFDIKPVAEAPTQPATPPTRAERADQFPTVVGYCPACGRHSLFLGAGGFVTCAQVPCPDPCAASDLLAQRKDEPR